MFLYIRRKRRRKKLNKLKIIQPKVSCPLLESSVVPWAYHILQEEEHQDSTSLLLIGDDRIVSQVSQLVFFACLFIFYVLSNVEEGKRPWSFEKGTNRNGHCSQNKCKEATCKFNLKDQEGEKVTSLLVFFHTNYTYLGLDTFCFFIYFLNRPRGRLLNILNCVSESTKTKLNNKFQVNPFLSLLFVVLV